MDLNLKRPLLFFDIESTGLNISADSIIELSFVKVFPQDPEPKIKTWKIKPWDYLSGCQRPIDPKASEVNGVKDEDLVNCPTFYEVVDEVVEWIKGSDLAGFNSAKFDLPMLAEEIERVRKTGKQVDIDLHEPLMVDVQNIYHQMEPRNLRAAYRFYCGGEDFENAHTAEADTVATFEVLKAQLDRYPDLLKNDVSHLSTFGAKKYVDFAGNLVFDEKHEPIVNFGKHKGKKLREVFDTDKSYFAWIENGMFPLDTKAQFRKYAWEFSHGPASESALEALANKFSSR